MAKIITLKASKYFGDCPKCRHNDGYMNVGRNHWFVCKKHKVKWFFGTDVFPTWRSETQDTWWKNASLLSGFLEIEPFQKWKNLEDFKPTSCKSHRADVVPLRSSLG